MNAPSITVTILAYQSKNTIAQCIQSIFALAYDGRIEVYVREQAGDNDEFRLLEKLAAAAPAHRPIHISQGENLGFSRGHNELIRAALKEGEPRPASAGRESQSDLILCFNADAVLMPDFLTQAVSAFQDASVGAVQGKIYRWNVERNDVRRGPAGKPIIDTTGLLPLRSRRIIGRGQGEEDNGQYDIKTAVWGADGAAPLYRRAALDDIAIPLQTVGGFASISFQEYFDENFFMYKEDVDLAWRLQLRGWKTAYSPTAIVWHERGSGDSTARSPIEIIRERRKIGTNAKYYSFGNQRLMQIKNETLQGFLRDLFPWLIKELGAWVVVLATEQRAVPAIWRMFCLTPLALKKRRYIQKHKEVDADPYRFFQ